MKRKSATSLNAGSTWNALAQALCFGALFFWPLLSPMVSFGGETNRLLKIFTRDENGCRHFYLQNNSIAAVTSTIEMSLDNVKSTTEFPHTFVLAAHQTLDAFSVSLIDADLPWHYRYTNFTTLGRADSTPDLTWVYELPFASGETFPISQGHHGQFSHFGADEFALDFKMPEGTPVHAARSGLVIEVQDQFTAGGADRELEPKANRILIQHDDGTIAIYGHLQARGSRVAVGAVVAAGEWIGLSGNTGFTSGAHLHFAVFKPRNGRERESLPVQFATANHGVTIPVTGIAYEATRPLPPMKILPPQYVMLASAFN